MLQETIIIMCGLEDQDSTGSTGSLTHEHKLLLKYECKTAFLIHYDTIC